MSEYYALCIVFQAALRLVFKLICPLAKDPSSDTENGLLLINPSGRFASDPSSQPCICTQAQLLTEVHYSLQRLQSSH